MAKTYPPCLLCGQPVKLAGFSLPCPQSGETRHFCCEGCLRIYQLLEPERDTTHPRR